MPTAITKSSEATGEYSHGREVLGFFVAPLGALVVYGLERAWFGGTFDFAFRPFVIVLFYAWSVLFGLPVHDFLFQRRPRLWAYIVGGIVAAAAPFLPLVPVFHLYAWFGAAFAAPCGAAWGASLWMIGVRNNAR